MDSVERWLKRRFPKSPLVSNETVLRLWFRSSYLCLAGLLAAVIPFFGSLMSILGAFGFTPTSFVIPSILVLVYYRDGRNGGISTWYRYLNWFLVVYFSSTTMMAGISAIRSIGDKIQNAVWFA